ADPAISLLGQADAAREWIDDRHRNHHQRQMSPAFFRRWLNREHASIQARQAPFPTEKRVRNATGSPRRTTLTSHDPYAAFIERRVQEVKATAPARRALVEQEAVV
ncbi:MAG: hypothetical protein J2P36_03585, partial [Ktedonobacteraceae bacterium]|nr:hypothetical protein [Ktedonobacteraceae bacterium]